MWLDWFSGSRLLAVALVVVGCGNGDDGGLPDGGNGPDGGGSNDLCAQACGLHEVCDASSGVAVCSCAPAYAKDASNACAFAGAPADPGLADPTKWTIAGTGLTVEPTSSGSVDVGEAIFTHDGMCGFATASQTFTMPPLDRAEPFKLVVTHAGTQQPLTASLNGALLAIGVGDQWTDVRVQPSAYRTDSICLGAAAYGGPVAFRIGMFPASGMPCAAGAQDKATLKVDQIQVLVADPGECPAPGSVLNGDFEGATGWTFSSVQAGTGALVDAAGEAGTKGAQLNGTNRCSEVTMTGNASFPAKGALAHPAVDVYWQGTSGERLVFQIGGKNVATLNANGSAAHARVCVPAWALGNVQAVGFFMQRHSDNACTAAYSQSFTIDNLQFVDEPACTATGDLTDPGFERVADLTGPVTGWGNTHSYVNDVRGLSSAAIDAPGSARTGNGVLSLQWSNPCSTYNDGGSDLTLTVPSSNATGGPAVKFFANVATANKMSEARLSLQPIANGSTAFVTSPPNGTYTAQTLCLPPALSGRRVTVRASLGDAGGGCGSVASESALWDDFEIGTDASCPGQ